MEREFNDVMVEKFKGIRTVSVLHDRILYLAKYLGFDGFDYTRWDDADVDSLITTIPDEVFMIYEADGLAEDDIIFDYLDNNSLPIFQSSAYRLLNQIPFNTNAQKQAIEVERLFSSVGINDSYAIPIKKRGNEKAVFTVYCKELSKHLFPKKIKKVKYELHMLASAIYRFQVSRPARFFHFEQNKNVLTARQLEVLSVLAKHAVSQKDAAYFLGITPSTVEKHCKAAVLALGAVSINNAIYLAATQLKIL